MPRIEAFYSRREARRFVDAGVFHNNSTCRQGRDVKMKSDDRNGTGNYRLCHDCDDRNFSEDRNTQKTPTISKRLSLPPASEPAAAPPFSAPARASVNKAL
jgi:hypothetical protein